MTILDFVINFITAVKADNVKRGKEYKGCHTVYSVLDGFNINEAIRQIFGADIKDVDALKRFPIEQINILLKSGKIIGN